MKIRLKEGERLVALQWRGWRGCWNYVGCPGGATLGGLVELRWIGRYSYGGGGRMACVDTVKGLVELR